jgi:hypothetical protein
MDVPSAAAGEEPKEKWTAKRIAVITWNYITTFKVHLP